MLEPVLASIVALAWLGESLTMAEIVGGPIVLGGVGIAQPARAHHTREPDRAALRRLLDREGWARTLLDAHRKCLACDAIAMRPDDVGVIAIVIDDDPIGDVES